MKQDYAQSVSRHIEAMLDGVHTAIPGAIASFDMDRCQASVKPLAKYRKANGELIDYPMLANVPVMFPQGAASGLALPVKSRDCCLLIFAERTLDMWRAGGEVDTPPEQKFDLSSAVALVGLFARPSKYVKEASATGATIIWAGGNKVAVSQAGISITGQVTIDGALILNGLNIGSHRHSTGQQGADTGTPI